MASVLQDLANLGYQNGLSPLIDRVISWDYDRRIVPTEELLERASTDRVWRLEDRDSSITGHDLKTLLPADSDGNIEYFLSPHYPFKDPFVAEIEDKTADISCCC